MDQISISPMDKISETSSAMSSRSFLKRYGWQRYRFEHHWDYLLLTLAITLTVDTMFSFCISSKDNTQCTLIHAILVYIGVGLPLNYMQVATGQYSQLGVIFFKHMSPIGHGIGYVMLVNSIYHSVFYSIFVADYIIYAMASFHFEIPWMECAENATLCWGLSDSYKCKKNCLNESISLSAFIYWKEIHMEGLEIPPKVIGIAAPILKRVVSLTLAWLLVYFCISSGVLKYIPILRVLFIFIFCSSIVLMFLCIVTKGALKGMTDIFFVNPHSLYNLQAWSESAYVVYSSLAIGKGCHMTYGSFMPPSMRAELLTIAGVVINLLAVFFGSLITHASVGIIMYEAGVEDFQVVWKKHIRPYFSVMPQGLGFMGVAQLWSFIYFLTCASLLFNNLITQIDTLERSVADAHSRFRVYRRYTLATVCILGFTISTFFISKESLVIANKIFRGSLKWCTCLQIFIMSILIFWIYGVERLCDDIHFISGSQPTKYWKIAWYLMPLITGVCAFYVDTSTFGETDLTIWVNFIASAVMLCPIPIFAMLEVFRYLQQHNLVGLLQPEERWGPPDSEERILRYRFNPREEIRSRRRNDACKHKCLLSSRTVEKAILDEVNWRRDVLQHRASSVTAEDF